MLSCLEFGAADVLHALELKVHSSFFWSFHLYQMVLISGWSHGDRSTVQAQELL